MKLILQFLKFMVPHGLVELRRKALFRNLPPPPAGPSSAPDRNQFHEERRRVIATVQQQAAAGTQIDGMNRDGVVAFLTARGIPKQHLIEGSIPAASLSFLQVQMAALVSESGPLFALHIGNFVGVSLAFLTATCRQRHSDSLVVGIDPNLPHRGISNPQAHVAALLAACGLQRNAMLIAGYSGVKSISNDGVTFEGYDPATAFANESACEQTLLNLQKFLTKTFHVAVMDGNHHAAYLVEEIRQLKPLMRPGGLIVLDDVDAYWSEIKAVFENLPQLGLTIIATDGRVGIARVSE